MIAVHVLAITVLSNLGKVFPAFCYRREASFRERLAVAICMFPRGEVGAGVLAVSLSVFAFTTILGWAYYGEKCWTYLVGTVCEKPFRIFWTISAFVGAVATLDFAWLVADTLNALMAIPNLISLLLLSPVIVQLTREYFARQDNQA